jgi:hypothetical protein
MLYFFMRQMLGQPMINILFVLLLQPISFTLFIIFFSYFLLFFIVILFYLLIHLQGYYYKTHVTVN